MPEYLSPGIYIEEVPSGPVPIQGVSTGTAGFVGRCERGPLQPTLVMSWLEFQQRFGGLPRGDEIDKLGYLPHAVQGFFQNGGQRAYIARVLDADSALKLARLEVASGKDRKLVIDAIGPGNAGANVLVKFDEGSLRDPKTKEQADLFRMSVVYYRGDPDAPSEGLEDLPDPDLPDSGTSPGFREPTMRETFDNLSLDPHAPNHVAKVVNAASKLIRISETGPPLFGAIPKAATAYRALGIAKPVAPRIPDPAAYQGSDSGDPAEWTGLKGLAKIDEVAILCIPDQGLESLFKPLTVAMKEHCEAVGRCFAIAQFPQDPGPLGKLNPPTDSSYVAVYVPWFRVQDPETAELLTLPPSGHLAGVYARTDMDRGVHKAPANETLLGPILQDVQGGGPFQPTITAAQQEVLNPRNINVLRDFRAEGRGLRVWGARTTSSSPDWRYISVRRLFIYLEHSIRLGTQWVVFEANDDFTWERVRSSVSGFLNTAWRNGALMGTTPDQAYFVRCDRTTMTQNDIDNGRLICEIGVAPVKPAEFIIFRIGQKTAEVQS